MSKEKIFSYEQAMESCLEYFNNNDLAAKIFLDKYALRNLEGKLIEETPNDTHRRLAKEFARIEKDKFKNPLTENEIFKYLEGFKKIVPQGSPMFGIGNKYQYVSISNCFVLPSALDSYGGILFTDEQLVQVSKRRGGVGHDVSNLRPINTPTKNAATTSTGVVSFMSRFSNTIREVGQNGRRGAEMMTCSIHHPESVILWDSEVDGEESFISVDREENNEIKNYKIPSKYYNPNRIDFTTCKYDSTKVTGANISLRLTDEFLDAVDNDKDYEQRWPVDSKNPKIKKNVNAKEAWNKIIYSAWQMAEPGVLFWDNIIKESIADCYKEYGFETLSTNPCGEVPLSKYDSCRLLALNLFGFVKNPFTEYASFEYEEFFETAKIAQRLMDDLVDLESEAIEKIIEKIKSDPEDDYIKNNELTLWENILEVCKTGRRTGTGITALGDTIAALNISYGSKEGVEIVDRIYKVLKFACYESSIEMAKEIGHFPVFNHDLEKDNSFLNRIKNEKVEINNERTINGCDIWENNKKYGRRNISLLTTAPVGSVSNLCKLTNRFGTSSGIEPQYSIKPYTRRKKCMPGDENRKVDFIDKNGDEWTNFDIFPSCINEWSDITKKEDTEESPWFNNCAEDLDWEIRVKIQSVAQKHVDHSISSTVNVPNETGVEEISKIYESAWKNKCKGITVYRDGCRSGVLIKNNKNIEKREKIINIIKTQAPKRPSILPCDVNHLTYKHQRYYVVVGLFNGEPYEVFTGINHDNEGDIVIPRSVSEGQIYKKSRGTYILVHFDKSNKETKYQLTNGHNDDTADSMTRLISTSLRHGIDMSYIIHQLEKTKGDLICFSKVLARTIKKYITDGTAVSGVKCPQCENEKLQRISGCIQCPQCGWSGCG